MKNADEFSTLIKNLLSSDQPPQPEELSSFSYDFRFEECGNGIDSILEQHRRLVLLACLRHKRYADAARMLLPAYKNTKLRTDLLAALGFDARKATAGAWLAGQYGALESLCKEGSDYATHLSLRWAELHWEDAVTIRKRSGYLNTGKEPQIPALELLVLLQDGNDVRPETKEEISEFLSKNAGRLYDHRVWFQNAFSGAGKWLTGLARDALTHEKNAVRKLGERVLRGAGEQGVRADLNPSAHYRLFVNGELWTSDKRGGLSPWELWTKFPSDSTKVDAGTVGPDGILTIEPDHFSPREEIKEACLFSRPASEGTDDSHSVPWIRAQVPLPASLGEVTDIRIETIPLTIKPKLPHPASRYKGKTIEIHLAWPSESQPPQSHVTYTITGNQCLDIERVQPGKYWLRVRAPGAAMTGWQAVEVTPKTKIIEPKLEKGASVAIAVSWPKNLNPKEVDPLLAKFRRANIWPGLPGAFTLERNGASFELPDASAGNQETTPDRLVLQGLPIGRYTLTVHSSDDLIASIFGDSAPKLGPGGWKQAQISFVVSGKSPAEIQTAPLELTSKE